MTLILSSTSCSSKGKNMLGMSRSVALLTAWCWVVNDLFCIVFLLLFPSWSYLKYALNTLIPNPHPSTPPPLPQKQKTKQTFHSKWLVDSWRAQMSINWETIHNKVFKI